MPVELEEAEPMPLGVVSRRRALAGGAICAISSSVGKSKPVPCDDSRRVGGVFGIDEDGFGEAVARRACSAYCSWELEAAAPEAAATAGAREGRTIGGPLRGGGPSGGEGGNGV